MTTPYTTTNPHPNSPTTKTTKRPHPGGPYRNTANVTAGDLCRLITSAKFRELERAIKTVRAAERVLRNLPEALATINRPMN